MSPTLSIIIFFIVAVVLVYTIGKLTDPGGTGSLRSPRPMRDMACPNCKAPGQVERVDTNEGQNDRFHCNACNDTWN